MHGNGQGLSCDEQDSDFREDEETTAHNAPLNDLEDAQDDEISRFERTRHRVAKAGKKAVRKTEAFFQHLGRGAARADAEDLQYLKDKNSECKAANRDLLRDTRDCLDRLHLSVESVWISARAIL